MTITTEEFIKDFHSLTGTTIGERRKNLFLLLKRTSQSIELGSGDVDFTCMQPKTPLEENFRVEVLIHFKKVPELIEVLKSENPILIEKVLKISSWFLEELLENINEEQLVEQLFPCLSFNAKVKIVNKLSLYLKNTRKADAIFEAINNKYGLYLASKLLPCCSKDVIIGIIKRINLELTPRQLLMIVEKHPDLTESILEALDQFHRKPDIACKYKNVFKHLMKNNVELFLKLHKEYQPFFRIGWRATDRLISTNKQDIIQHASHVHKFLHNKQIVKSFNQDFSEFYFNMFPSSPYRFKDNMQVYTELISSLPSKFDLLSTTFKRAYNEELWNHSMCITPAVLELMTPVEREVWMQKHERPKEMSEDVWNCLKKTDLSIPLLKEKISLMSDVKERAGLVGCLVETCRINKDKAALIEICKYVLAHHRNDKPVVLCFLRTLKDCFSLDDFDDEHWKYINEIVHLIILWNEIPYYYHEWMYAYIRHLLIKQRPIKQHLIDMSKKMNISCNGGMCMEEPRYQKQALIHFCEAIPALYTSETLENGYIEFLNAVLTYNRKNPKDQISIFAYKEAINCLKSSLKKKENYHYMASMIAANILQMKIPKTEKVEWLDLLCEKKNFCSDMSGVEYLIKYEPDLVAKYIDSLLNLVLDLWYTILYPLFWKCCKNYTHLGIPQKIKANCLSIISSKEENESRKKNAITALSYVMEPEEFLKFITPYYPDDSKMDITSEENQEVYKLQQAITASLKNVIPPSVVLESVLNFSKGDYLKFIQRSLHSISLSVAENKLLPFYVALSDRAVSVRKHAICHTFKVLDKSETFRLLTKSMEIEKNSSIRKVLFKAIFNYFAKNPDDYVWNLVKENVKAVDINDNEAFEILMEIKKVPLQYLSQYIVFTWEILDTLPNPPNSVTIGKCQLLNAVSSNVILSFTDEFCMNIIKKYLFQSKELTDLQTKVFNFSYKYVLYSDSELKQEEHLQEVFMLVKDYIGSTWTQASTRSVGRDFICRFVKEFCWFALSKKSCIRNIFSKFVELWSGSFQPHEAFDEYLCLQFTLIYLDYVTHNLTLLQIVEKIVKLCDPLINVYGPCVSSILSSSLNMFVTHFVNNDETLENKRLILIDNIIKVSTSPHCMLLIILLLPNACIWELPDSKRKYNGIINTLYRCTDPAVHLSLSCYLYNTSNYFHELTLAQGTRLSNDRKQQRLRAVPMYIEHYSSKYRDS